MRLPDGRDPLRDWPVPDGVARRGSILLVHGLGRAQRALRARRRAARRARARGARLRPPRARPARAAPRGGVPHPDALLDDLRAVFDDLAAAAGDGAPPFLLGHSLGGAVAARAATGGWVDAARADPLLPGAARPADRPRRSAALLAVARRLAPDRGFPNRLPVDKLSHDPAVVAAYRADELVHDRITPRLYDFLVDAGAGARRDAPRFTVPTLLLVAGADRLVDPRGAREFAAALPAGVGTLHWYDGLYHELFNEREPDRERVLADLDAWLEASLTLDSSVS